MEETIDEIYNNHYKVEERSVLQLKCDDEKLMEYPYALNEIAVLKRDSSSMISIHTAINGAHLTTYQADGLVIATPTGSTAYSLSAGGPILTPSLDAITLVPMFPHTLSARPLVINGDSTIRLRFSHRCSDLEISCDSQIALPIQDGEDVLIRRCDYHLNLIHPKDYSYFNTLSTKLGWSKKLF